MVTISILALRLLLTANQGKHLPRSILQGTIPPGMAGIGPGICVGGFSAGPCTRSQELRKPLETVTISTLALLLPASQGKHLPQSKLQDTTSPCLAGIGPGVRVGGFQYLPPGKVLTAPGPPPPP